MSKIKLILHTVRLHSTCSTLQCVSTTANWETLLKHAIKVKSSLNLATNSLKAKSNKKVNKTLFHL